MESEREESDFEKKGERRAICGRGEWDIQRVRHRRVIMQRARLIILHGCEGFILVISPNVDISKGSKNVHFLQLKC